MIASTQITNIEIFAFVHFQLYDALKFIFGLSLEKGISPDGLKLIRVTPTFEGGNRPELGSLIHNHFHKYLKENKIICSKQFVL